MVILFILSDFVHVRGHLFPAPLLLGAVTGLQQHWRKRHPQTLLSKTGVSTEFSAAGSFVILRNHEWPTR